MEQKIRSQILILSSNVETISFFIQSIGPLGECSKLF